MKERTTQILLATVAILLTLHLFRSVPLVSTAGADGEEPVAEVLRARAFELVDTTGKVVAQLHLGQDGSGNIRLRSGDGTVRVKLGAGMEGSGLVLMDKDSDPAVWLAVNGRGTSATLAEKGKETKVITP